MRTDQEPVAVPTLEDVARLANVSRATASRVINGSPLVRPETAKFVLDAVAQLGYRPNEAARSLVKRRAGVVAVVVLEPHERVFKDPFFSQMYAGIQDAMDDPDILSVLVMDSTRIRDDDRLLSYLSGGSVDGAIVISHRKGRLTDQLAALSLPTVFVGRPLTKVEPVLSVCVDSVVGGRLAATHLADRGSRRLAMIAGPTDMSVSTDRVKGF